MNFIHAEYINFAIFHFIPNTSPLICLAVHISFENFRSVPPFLRDGDSDDEQSREELYSGDEDTKPQVTVSRGHRRSKGVPVGATTKHDPVICGRKNVKSMEKFPPAFPAGDMNDETQDYRLPNAVFNTLKLHSQKEEKYVSRIVVLYEFQLRVLVLYMVFSVRVKAFITC